MKGLTNLFLRTVAAIFYCAALLKLLTLVVAPESFQGGDAVFPGLAARWVMVAAGLLESSVATVILAVSNSRLALGLSAWLSTLLVLYRVSMVYPQAGGCPCLGAFGPVVSAAGVNGARVSEFLLGYLLIGSFGLLLAEFLVRAVPRPRQWFSIQGSKRRTAE